MKLGVSTAGLLVISMTSKERQFLLGDRVTIAIHPEDARQFVRLEGTDKFGPGTYTLGQNPKDTEYPYRIAVSKVYHQLASFGTEEVQTWSSGRNLLNGNRPNMNRALIVRAPMARQKAMSATNMPGLDHLKEAVQLINNMKDQYGDQLEVTIEAGKIKARLFLEI